MSANQESELEMFPSTHEIEEIFEEEIVDGNNPTNSQNTDQLPVNRISSVRPVSPVASASVLSKKYCHSFTFMFSILFSVMSLFFTLLLVYYKPFPPQLHLIIPESYVHRYTFKDINTTFLLKFNNPNHRLNLDLHDVVAKLHFGYNSHTSKELSPISLQVHEDRFLKVHFFEKGFEFKPDIDSDVRTAITHNRYIFSLTISIKLKVHLDQLPFAFPYSVVLKCHVEVIDYSPTGSVQYSSCE